MIGIVRYDAYLINISSTMLKTVYRGENLHKVAGLPKCFLGMIHPLSLLPVLSRKILNKSLDKFSKSKGLDDKFPLKTSTHKIFRQEKYFAHVETSKYSFAFPIDEPMAVEDDVDHSSVLSSKDKLFVIGTTEQIERLTNILFRNL